MPEGKLKSAFMEVRCPICGKLFGSEDEMLAHYDQHGNEEIESHRQPRRRISKKICAVTLISILIAVIVLGVWFYSANAAANRVNALKSMDSDGDGLSNWDEIYVYHTNPYSAYTSTVVVNGTYRLDDFNAVKVYNVDPNNATAVRAFIQAIPNVTANHLNNSDYEGGYSFDKAVAISLRDPYMQCLASHSEIKWTQYQNGYKCGQLLVNGQQVCSCYNTTSNFIEQPSYYFTHQRIGECAQVSLATDPILTLMGYKVLDISGAIKLPDGAEEGHNWLEAYIDGSVWVVNFGALWPREGYYQANGWTIYNDTSYDPNWYLK